MISDFSLLSEINCSVLLFGDFSFGYISHIYQLVCFISMSFFKELYGKDQFGKEELVKVINKEMLQVK